MDVLELLPDPILNEYLFEAMPSALNYWIELLLSTSSFLSLWASRLILIVTPLNASHRLERSGISHHLIRQRNILRLMIHDPESPHKDPTTRPALKNYVSLPTLASDSFSENGMYKRHVLLWFLKQAIPKRQKFAVLRPNSTFRRFVVAHKILTPRLFEA